MQLSPRLSLAELTVSANVARLGLDNSPPPNVLNHLRATAHQLQRVCAILGNRPLIISSGYRSEAVNRAAKGARGSAYLSGYGREL